MDDIASLPLISIIVPVYNVKDYLEKCLQSICGQTYRNLEIILIDDGSSDGSGELCDTFAQRDERIKVIRQANAGQSAARNRGLAVAQGEYLGFVDGDDWIEPDMYGFLYRLLKENEADISICSHYRDKGGKSVAKYASGEQFAFARDEGIRELVVDKHVRNYMWDKLFKRQLFTGISFPVGHVFEDLAICYKLFYAAEKVVVQDSPKYHYVIRECSTMQGKYDFRKELDLFYAVCSQVSFALEKEICSKTSIDHILKRGIHFINHCSMLALSEPVASAMQDVIARMRLFEERYSYCPDFPLRVNCYFIYCHLESYRIVYRFARKLFKSKRHRF